jgi:hypothetical protein
MIAADLWGRTHTVEPAAAAVAGDETTNFNGRLLISGAAVAGRSQDDETKPIPHPEAG